MVRNATGVFTLPGRLSFFLADLELTRQELAERMRVSVRTVYNLEHGRKRVELATVIAMAHVLNAVSQEKRPQAPPLGLNEHHFLTRPDSIVDVAMQSITSNRPDYLDGENPSIDPSLRWWINGDPERLAWTGLFDVQSLGGQINEFYRCFDYLGVEGTRKFLSPRENKVVIRTQSNIQHPGSGKKIKYTSFIEFSLRQGRLQAMEATFDSILVANFLETGQPPRRRLGLED